MPKVSIIIPVYNVEPYLRECLDSVVHQTLKDIEIVVINDGSTDGCQSIIDEYSKKFSSIRSYKQKNSGLCYTRNLGIKYAKGKYVAFLDSDDFVDRKAYKLLYDFAEKGKYDVAICDFYWKYSNKLKVDKHKEFNNDKELLINTKALVWNKIIKREILIKNKLYFTEGLRYEDVDFNYKLINCTNNIGLLHIPLIYYRQRSDSFIGTKNMNVRDIYSVLNNVYDYYRKNDLYNKYFSELEFISTRYILGSSYLRACKISPKENSKIVLDEGWQFLNRHFPNWRHNKYLKGSMKNYYFKFTTHFSYNFLSGLFRRI